MEPFTAKEIGRYRRQQINGWSIAKIAEHWGRTTAEVDLALWTALGRPNKDAAPVMNTMPGKLETKRVKALLCADRQENGTTYAVLADRYGVCALTASRWVSEVA